MKFWDYGNARVSRPMSRVLAALGISILAYFHTSTLAYCGDLSGGALAKAEAAVGLLSTATNAADSNGVKLKVTGVAVVDDNSKARGKVEFLPPETRVVVSSDKHLALFRVEYDVPTNMNVRIYLEVNGYRDEFGLGCNFGISGSALCSGAGVGARILRLDGKNGREGSDLYDDGLLVKSVRLSCYEEGDKCGFYVCDAPVNVLFAKDGETKTDGIKVLEPLPPPPAKSLSLLPGWTEDFKAACAQAAKDGKLVLAYFLNSRPGDDGKATKVLDHEVLGSEEFLKRAGESYVFYMAELYKPSQSWIAGNNVMSAFKYSARKETFSPPEVAIVHPDGSRVALLDRGGWEGGVDGYLAKMEKERKAGLAKQEAAKKAREEAAKKIPLKTNNTSTPAGFTDNLDEALAKAKAEGKLVYVCFSGSDWCYWCKKLEEEVLSDPLFVAGVMDGYILVFIDSPRDKSLLSERAKAENKKLIKKYGIKGYPTALILDGDGKKIDKIGYRRGGAAKYVEHLKNFRK